YVLRRPGMDARRFLRSPASEPQEQKFISRASKDLSSKMPERAGRTRALSHKRAKTAVATAKILLGAVLLFGLSRLAPHPLVTGWIGMIGMILALHFGMFALLAIAL